jgi:hypothetical protein
LRYLGIKELENLWQSSMRYIKNTESLNPSIL